MKFQVCLVLAMTLVGLVSARVDSQKEIAILGKLFDVEAEPMEPEKSLELLRELDSMYKADAMNTKLTESEEARRLLITSALSYAEVSEENCNQQKFNDLKYVQSILAPYPGVNKFITYYGEEQLALCKKSDPDFHVDTDEAEE